MYQVEKFYPGFGWDREAAFDSEIEANRYIEEQEESDSNAGFFFSYRITEV